MRGYISADRYFADIRNSHGYRYGYGYFATDILRICITPLFYFFKFYFMYIVYNIHRHKLQVIELSSVELSTHQDQ